MYKPTSSHASSRADQATFAGLLLCFALLLFLHRYPGIAHDALLYMGGGLARQAPDIFGNDLFFLHGGQDRYSLMPWLLGSLFRLASPPQVFMWGALASLLLFAGASWWLLRALLPQRQRSWAWLGIVSLPPIYGVVGIFGYNEPFLTSRPIAEAFGLLAVASLARSRWWLAAGCLLVAGLFHPLQAIAVLLVIWPWAVMRHQRWLHAAWAVVPLLALAYSGVHPFDGLLRVFDPQWLGSVERSRQIFLTEWGLADFKVLGFDVFVLVLGWRQLPPAWAQWCRAAIVGLGLGLASSYVLVDLLHLVLPAGLQLWRVHWLAHWFAIASLAALLFVHIRDREPGPALLLMLAAQLSWGETPLGGVVLAMLYLAWPALVASPRERLAMPLAWAFATFLALLFANHALNETRWFLQSGADLRTYPLDYRLLLFPAAGFGLALLGLGLRRTRSVPPAIVAIAAIVLLGLAAWRWDARAPLVRSMEGASGAGRVFGVVLPRDAQVFWYPETLLGTWLVLRRASYLSDSQLAGQMFDRSTFEEGRARALRVQPLMREVDACIARDRRVGRAGACVVSAASLDQACKPGSPRPPDVLVLPYAQPWPSAGRWEPARHGRRLAQYWLYSCEAARNAAPNAAASR